MTRYAIVYPKGKVRWLHAAAEGQKQTACGKPVTSTWKQTEIAHDGRAASGKVNCRTCRTKTLRLHKEEIEHRPKTPAGTMYASLKTRGV